MNTPARPISRASVTQLRGKNPADLQIIEIVNKFTGDASYLPVSPTRAFERMNHEARGWNVASTRIVAGTEAATIWAAAR
jgi:hypothetical protein